MAEPVIIEQYLEARFREYFRDATAINVHEACEDDEETVVFVILPSGTKLKFVCEPGSDDDCFEFCEDADPHGRIFTIPFPEAEC